MITPTLETVSLCMTTYSSVAFRILFSHKDSPDAYKLDFYISAERLFEALGKCQALIIRLLVELVCERDLFWIVSG